MMGGFANALMLIMGIVLEAILFFFVISYAAHCFLTVIQETAAGNDEILWPDEPFYDWIAKGAYMVALAAVWFAPLGIISRILRDNEAAPTLSQFTMFLAIMCLWALFPVSILSALSGNSKWTLMRTSVLVDLTRLLPSVLIFHMASGVILGVIWGTAYFVCVMGHFYGVILLGLTAAWGLLVYGRLIGRLAWQLGQLKPPKKKKTKTIRIGSALAQPEDLEPRQQPAKIKDAKPKAKPASTQAVLDPKAKEMVEGYALAPEPAPNRPLELPLDGYRPVGHETISVKASSESDAKIQRDMPQPSATEMRLAEKRTKPSSPPDMPMVSGVFSFPFYNQSLSAFVKLALGFTGLAAVAIFIRNYLPW